MATPYYIHSFDDTVNTQRRASDTDTATLTFQADSNSAWGIAGSNDGTQIFTAHRVVFFGAATEMKIVKHTESNTSSPQWTQGFVGSENNLVYEPSEDDLYVATDAPSSGDPSTIRRLDATDGSTITTFNTGHLNGSVDVDATGAYIIYDNTNNSTVVVEKYDFQGNKVWDTQSTSFEPGAIAANGDEVAIATTGGNISRRDASDGTENSSKGYNKISTTLTLDMNSNGDILASEAGTGFGASGGFVYQKADGTTVWSDSSVSFPIEGAEFGESGVAYLCYSSNFEERDLATGNANFTESQSDTVKDVYYANQPRGGGGGGSSTVKVNATKVDTDTTANSADTLFTTPITASPVSTSAAVSTPSIKISQPATQTNISATSNGGSVSAFNSKATPADVSASVATGDVTPVALAEASQVGAQTALKSPDIEFILNRQPATQVSMSTEVLDATNTRTQVGTDTPQIQATVAEASVPSAEVDADKPQVTASMNGVDVIARLDTSGTIVDVIAIPSESDTLADFVTESDNLVTVSSDVDASTLRTFIGRGYGDVTNADKIDTQ